MATLIAKLPSIGRPDGTAGSNTGHQRLESAPPSPLVEETDLATLPNESTSPSDDSNRKRWKGKGIDPSERRGSSSPPAEEGVDGVEPPEASALSGGPTESYPPTNDEALETRKVQENLRRWEEAERQRRKAARDSRAARTPSTLIADVAGYVTSFGSSKPASRRKDSRTDSVGTIPTIPDGTATRAGGWTAASTRDSEDVELESTKDSRRTPPDATPTKADFQKRVATRPSLSSIATTDTGSTVTSGPRNPFSTSSSSGVIPAKPSEDRDEPFTPPDHHLISRESSTSSTATTTSTTSADDPFKNPEATKTDLDLPLLATPTNLSPATSPRIDKGMSLLQVPRSPTRPNHSSSKASKKTSAAKQAPPLVRPLDLPEPTMPRMEPEPASGHWRRVQDTKQRDRAIQEEFEEDQAKGGRWWTDWICGCREGNVREDQAGRTNPFE